MANPRKDELGFTQNFLHSRSLVERIVGLASLRRGDVVLEIGPGRGIITRALAQTVGPDGQVVAVEYDDELAASLDVELRAFRQIRVVHADILQFDFASLGQDYAVFANVPFNITSALLETVLDPSAGPRQAHLILQIEALEAVNEHGPGAETLKSLMIKPLYNIDNVYRFRRSDFAPAPAVETSLFAFHRRREALVLPADYEAYKDFLAVVTKDRAGEGSWLRLFSKAQLQRLSNETGLTLGRGLRSQSFDAMLAAFRLFRAQNFAKRGQISGAMQALRKEQERREVMSRSDNHRRRRR